MSCYALEAIYKLLAANLTEYTAEAQAEYDMHQRHDAWLCKHYYTIRAIFVLKTGPLGEMPRYGNYFDTIEKQYDVWQALVSKSIELFVELNIFQAPQNR